MKAFCIRIPGIEDSMAAETVELFRDEGVDVELFDGFKPSAGDDIPPWIRGAQRRGAGGALPGIYGCYASHLNLLRTARDEGLESVAVFESDSFPAEGFREAWESAPEIVGECGVFYLGHFGDRRKKRKAIRRGVFRIGGFYYGTHGYAVHRSVYDSLLKWKVPYPWDWALSMLGDRLGFAAAWPAVVGQRSRVSLIDGKRKAVRL